MCSCHSSFSIASLSFRRFFSKLLYVHLWNVCMSFWVINFKILGSRVFLCLHHWDFGLPFVGSSLMLYLLLGVLITSLMSVSVWMSIYAVFISVIMFIMTIVRHLVILWLLFHHIHLCREIDTWELTDVLSAFQCRVRSHFLSQIYVDIFCYRTHQLWLAVYEVAGSWYICLFLQLTYHTLLRNCFQIAHPSSICSQFLATFHLHSHSCNHSWWLVSSSEAVEFSLSL